MRGSRPYRRFVVRRIGNTRECLVWFFSLAFTIYLLDSYVLTTQLMLDIVRDEKPATPSSVTLRSDAGNYSDARNSDGNAVEAAAQAGDGKDEARGEMKDRPRCLVDCPAGQISYHVRSGEGHDTSPTICFGGIHVIENGVRNGTRGMNAVVIDNSTLRVIDVKAFDVYMSETELRRYLTRDVRDGHIVLIATMDDASNRLTDAGMKVLQGYGSTLITMLGFRDSFVMIGQKGLEESRAIERLLARELGKRYAELVEISGCASLPLGPLSGNIFGAAAAAESGQPAKADNKPGELGEDKPNCGVKEPCGNGSFSVQLFTGFEDKYLAKMCIGGRYVFAEGLNDAGRGLNMAVVSSKTMDVTRVGHFDTYAKDSSSVEFFMEMLNDGDIVIVVSYDDASKKLDKSSQDLFRTLGSSYANSLGFRDAWVFVGQQGMDGYSEIEELSPRVVGRWPDPIDKRVCVPTKLKGRKTPLAHLLKPNKS